MKRVILSISMIILMIILIIISINISNKKEEVIDFSSYNEDKLITYLESSGSMEYLSDVLAKYEVLDNMNDLSNNDKIGLAIYLESGIGTVDDLNNNLKKLFGTSVIVENNDYYCYPEEKKPHILFDGEKYVWNTEAKSHNDRNFISSYIVSVKNYEENEDKVILTTYNVYSYANLNGYVSKDYYASYEDAINNNVLLSNPYDENDPDLYDEFNIVNFIKDNFNEYKDLLKTYTYVFETTNDGFYLESYKVNS